jgi:endo-1,4-beta-xylanase
MTQPSANNFDFTQTDYFVKFASDHGMLFRGVPLIWYDMVPQWLNDKFKNPKTTSEEMQNILIHHISTIVKRYAGRVHSWDVVNEVIELDHGRSDGLRVDPWLKFLGSDYIDLAFRIAAQADPKALLVYNENNLEYDTPQYDAKRTAVLKLLERLKSKGTPIHALGIQSHLLGHETRFNPKKLRKFLADVASLGLKIMITELDVIDSELPLNPKVRDRMVASAYEDYLSVVLDEPAVTTVITWGLSDKYTWLSQAAPRPDRVAVRPLPLDSNFKRKLAWNAMARAFDKAIKR